MDFGSWAYNQGYQYGVLRSDILSYERIPALLPIALLRVRAGGLLTVTLWHPN